MVKGKQVLSITKEYGPVPLEEELEKRLVNEGIAEYGGMHQFLLICTRKRMFLYPPIMPE